MDSAMAYDATSQDKKTGVNFSPIQICVSFKRKLKVLKDKKNIFRLSSFLTLVCLDLIKKQCFNKVC